MRIPFWIWILDASKIEEIEEVLRVRGREIECRFVFHWKKKKEAGGKAMASKEILEAQVAALPV